MDGLLRNRASSVKSSQAARNRRLSHNPQMTVHPHLQHPQANVVECMHLVMLATAERFAKTSGPSERYKARETRAQILPQPA